MQRRAQQTQLYACAIKFYFNISVYLQQEIVTKWVTKITQVYNFFDNCRCVQMGWFIWKNDDQGLLIFSNEDVVTSACMTFYFCYLMRLPLYLCNIFCQSINACWHVFLSSRINRKSLQLYFGGSLYTSN